MTLRDSEAITCYYHGGPRDGVIEVLPYCEVWRMRSFPTRMLAYYPKDAEPPNAALLASVKLSYYRRTGPIIDFIAHYDHVPHGHA